MTHTKALRIAAAFAEARDLIDQFGEDDPRSLRAIMKAVELQDPGFTKKAMAECGISMPKPTHYSDSGEPLFSAEAIALALGEDPQEVQQRAEEMLKALGETPVTSANPIQ
jgi:hypothetical protein